MNKKTKILILVNNKRDIPMHIEAIRNKLKEDRQPSAVNKKQVLHQNEKMIYFIAPGMNALEFQDIQFDEMFNSGLLKATPGYDRVMAEVAKLRINK